MRFRIVVLSTLALLATASPAVRAASDGPPGAAVSQEAVSAAEARLLQPAAAKESPSANPESQDEEENAAFNWAAFQKAQQTAESAGKEDKDRIYIETPSGYLDFDEETNQIYGRERTKVIYGDTTLEADRLIMDVSLFEVQAEGNVVISGNDREMKCDNLRYNFKTGYGAAYEAQGKIGVLHFRSIGDSTKSGFEQISPEESLFRNVDLTTCDFPIPMYSLRAREMIIYSGDRVLLRSVVLRVRGVPVFYFPFYSRSLAGGTPWFFRMGTGKRTGFFLRVGYSYRHENKVPSWEDDKTLVTRSRGHLDVFVDMIASAGLGAGLKYKYEFDEGAHIGEVDLYGLSGDNRDIKEQDSADPNNDNSGALSGRWQALVLHRSQLTDDAYLQVNIDEVSDPEVYYDILDNFTEIERGRLPERSATAALTLNKDDYIGRVTVETKDRIGLDRFSDFSNPNDDNRDFDIEPGVENKEDEGLPTDRWGNVSIKAPEINLATNNIRLRESDFYYRAQMNLFNSLDRGINIVGDKDDIWVQGVDFYQSLTHIHRFNDKVTWMNKGGIGLGFTTTGTPQELADGSRGFAPAGTIMTPAVFAVGDPHPVTGLPLAPNDPLVGQPIGFYDGLYFTDPETWHIGQSDTLASYNDINNALAYADLESRLNARFTEALSGFLRYRGRFTTADSLGDWHAKMGDRQIRSDLYNFPVRQSMLDAQLLYSLFYPALTLYARGMINLIPSLYPNESRWSYSVGGNWTSDDSLWTLSSDLTMRAVQYYHVDDPRATESTSLAWSANGRYTDPSELWWAGLGYRLEQFLGNSPGNEPTDTVFRENEARVTVNPQFGAHVGPKWTVVGDMNIDSRLAGFSDANFTLNRDLHDALLSLNLRIKQEIFDKQDETDAQNNNGLLNNLQFSFTITPKMPNAEQSIGVPHRFKVDEMFRPTALEREG